MINEPIQPGAYDAGAFHPGIESGRAWGKLRFNTSVASFASDKGGFELPLSGMKLALGGANDRLIYLTHPDHPDVAIHTADHSVLKDALLQVHPELLAQVGSVRRRKRTALAMMISVLGGILAMLLCLVLAKDRIVAAVANTVPADWEVRLGDTAFEHLMANRREINDPQLNAQLAAITVPLVAGIKDSRYPFKFHIIEDPTLNAFAVPGGNVVVHSGLLLEAGRPEEVAGVLAHEIAHVTHRHGFRSIVSSLGLYQVLSLFVGDASSLLAVLANNSAFLIDRKFSRDFEREADNAGWDYLLQAHIDPSGMTDFFKKLKAEEAKRLEKMPGGAGAEGALAILSTHPATDERMQSLEEKWEKVGKRDKDQFRKIDLNYPEFKNTLRARLHSAPDQKGTE